MTILNNYDPSPSSSSIKWRLVLVCVFFIGILSNACLGQSSAASEPAFQLGIQSALKTYNSNGLIWGNSVIHEIFTASGYEVEIKNAPALRLPVWLVSGKIDAYMFSEESENQPDDLLRSEFPLTVATFHIYYDSKKGWEPVWPPDNDFLAKEGKSQDGAFSLRKRFKLNITRTSSYDTAVKMVNQGRASYWIDHRGSVAKISPDLINSEAEGFRRIPLYQSGIYAWFQPSERGRQLRDIFNQGHLKLLENGQYAKVFYQHAPSSKSSRSVIDAIKYINANHPGNNFPVQNLSN